MLITKGMLHGMKPGSVVVDLSVGNCELTRPNEIVLYNGVKIMSYTNYPSRTAEESSKLYAKNIYNFADLLIDKDTKTIKINIEDEIIRQSLVTHGGKIVNSSVLKIMESA